MNSKYLNNNVKAATKRIVFIQQWFILYSIIINILITQMLYFWKKA